MSNNGQPQREFFDVKAFVHEDGGKYGRKTSAIRVGYAYKNDKGGMNLKLQSLPTNKDWDGNLLVERKQDVGARQSNSHAAPDNMTSEEDIPF